jgi:hypothetical protein
MRHLHLIIIVFLTTSLSSCSWLSSFFIINDTSDVIVITYKLLPTSEKGYEFAITDAVEFHKVVKKVDGGIDRKQTWDSKADGKFSKTSIDNQEVFTLTLSARTAATFGNSSLLNFSYGSFERRHKIFGNVIEMTIYRTDTQDSVTLKKSMLADLSRPFGRTDIALIFD